MSELVEWIDTPPPRLAGNRERLVNELRTNPGKWAVVKDQPSDRNGTWCLAQYLKSRFDGVEAVVRDGVVYARYVGDDYDG